MMTAVAAMVLALLVQFAGLVWGAAKISSSVEALKGSITGLSHAVSKLDSRVDNHEVRVSVLESHDPRGKEFVA